MYTVSAGFGQSFSKTFYDVPIFRGVFVYGFKLLLHSSYRAQMADEMDLPMVPSSTFSSLHEHLSSLLTDGILGLAYGIAILSVLKFVLHLINGFATNRPMGSSLMESSSFLYRTSGKSSAPSLAPRRGAHLVPSSFPSGVFSPLSAM